MNECLYEQMDFLGSASLNLTAQLYHWSFSGLDPQSCIHSLNNHLVLYLCYKEGLGACVMPLSVQC